MLEPAPNLWRTLTYYNGGHDESWNQQADLLEPAVGFVAYGGARVQDGTAEAGTGDSRVATATAVIHHCWNQQLFFAGNSDFFATTPLTMFIVLLERQVLLLEPFSFFVAIIISFCYHRFDFCWNKHSLFLLLSSWIFAGISVFFCYNCSSVLLEPAALFCLRFGDAKRASGERRRRATGPAATGAATVVIGAATHRP